MEVHCYCEVTEVVTHMIPCQECKKRFHIECLKSGKPSGLLCDTFFKLICANCSSSNMEYIERLKLPWTKVVILAIFNLQFEGGGKCGYFHWRDHICTFIDKNWNIFFGSKKKTNTWQGTVAGTLSSGCPTFFKSGLAQLGESGWWALITPTVPEVTPEDIYPQRPKGPRKKKQALPIIDEPMTQGLRVRNKKNAIQAAIELKEKRSYTSEVKARNPKIRGKEFYIKEEITTPSENWSTSLICENGNNCAKKDKYRIIGKEDEKFVTNIKSEPPEAIFSDCSNASIDTNNEMINLDIPQPVAHCSNDILYNMNWEDIGKEEEIEVDEFTVDNFSLDDEPNVTAILSSLSSESQSQLSPKISRPDHIGDEPASLSVENITPKPCVESQNEKKRKVEEITENNELNYKVMTECGEKLLLQRLQKLNDLLDTKKGACRLYRKLLVREENRKMKRPVFDLEVQYRAITGNDEVPLKDVNGKHQCDNVLDRFQVVCPSAQSRTHTSFVTRLLGFEDDQMESIISPYTMRILKPFIFRDYESVPLRVKLLREIIAYPHKRAIPLTK